MELGTDVGAPKTNCVLSRAETAEASALELTAENTGWTQERPPEPADEAKSTISGLHPIRVLVMDITTTGAVGLAGAATFTDNDEALVQAAHTVPV